MFLRLLKKNFKNKNFNELLTGTVWVVFGRLLSSALGLMVTVLVARYYGSDVVGRLALCNSVLMIGAMLSLFGFDVSIMRLLPEYSIKGNVSDAYSVFNRIVILILCSSIFVSGFMICIKALFPDLVFINQGIDELFILVCLFIFIKSILQFNSKAMRGLKLVKEFAFIQFLPQLFNLLSLLVLMSFLNNADVPIYALFISLVGTAVVAYMINIGEFLKQGAIRQKNYSVSTKVILSISFPMFIAAFVSMASSQAGLILLGVFHSDRDVGFFSVALRLATITGFLLKAVNTVAASKISELYHSDKIDELFVMMKSSAKLVFWTAFPSLIFLIFFGKFLLVNLFGEEFAIAYPPLLILVVAQFVNSLTGCTGIFMNMVGLQKEYRNIVVLGAILLLSMSVILTPSFGILGAAASVLVGECVWNLLALVYIKVKFGKTTGYVPFLGK